MTIYDQFLPILNWLPIFGQFEALSTDCNENPSNLILCFHLFIAKGNDIYSPGCSFISPPMRLLKSPRSMLSSFGNSGCIYESLRDANSGFGRSGNLSTRGICQLGDLSTWRKSTQEKSTRDFFEDGKLGFPKTPIFAISGESKGETETTFFRAHLFFFS
jgi:hypothetical protein